MKNKYYCQQQSLSDQKQSRARNHGPTSQQSERTEMERATGATPETQIDSELFPRFRD